MKLTTLAIKQTSGKTIGLTLVMLLVFIGIGEMVMRTEFFQAPLTPPQLGSNHYQLGHKLAWLDADIKRNGPVDCLMLGNSIVGRAFNPEVFQDAYKEASGNDIHCFNFGINASAASSTAVLAHILVAEYNPRLLIIGTDPRDYALSSSDPDVTTIVDSAWVQYRLGDFSLDGWLMDGSYLYRYRQHISRLLRFTYKDTLWSDTKLNFPILPSGLTEIDKVNLLVNDPPDPLDNSEEVAYFKKIYSPYVMLDENLDALEAIMEYHRAGTQVVIVEMSMADGLYYFFENGEMDYSRYIDRVNELASEHQVPFLRTEPLNLIPGDGWSDYIHLNPKGAHAFSTWLGKQVAALDGQVSADALQP
jgi:hypothetical protein